MSPSVASSPEYRKLVEENQELRERIAFIEREMLGTDLVLPRQWRLTKHEARLARLLIMRPTITRDAALTAMYRDPGEEEPEAKIVDVYICKLRKKLGPAGIVVHTTWGEGWFIDKSTRERLQRECQGDAP